MATLSIGKAKVGFHPLAGSVVHDPPVIVLTGPTGTVITGGPNLVFTWNYSQPQGDVQEQYRILLYQTGVPANVYHDTGWIIGSPATHPVDVDDLGIPHDYASYEATVAVRSWDARWEVTSAAVAFGVDFGTPHCTITLPLAGTVLTGETSIDVEWTFLDDTPGLIQQQYRVRLKAAGTGEVLYTTGWVVSAGTGPVNIPYAFADGSQYLVGVTLKNNQGIRSD